MEQSGCGRLHPGGNPIDICASQGKRGKIIHLIQYYLNRGDKSIIQETGCAPPCTIKHFKTNPPTVLSYYEEKSGVDESYRLKVKLSTKKTTLEQQEEIYVFTGNNLVADFGGFLGMLLGASCLTLFDGVIIAFERLQKFFGMPRAGKL